MIKYFRFSEKAVLWDMSWANVKLYSDSIPTGEAYGSETVETTGKDLFEKYKRKS